MPLLVIIVTKVHASIHKFITVHNKCECSLQYVFYHWFIHRRHEYTHCIRIHNYAKQPTCILKRYYHNSGKSSRKGKYIEIWAQRLWTVRSWILKVHECSVRKTSDLWEPTVSVCKTHQTDYQTEFRYSSASHSVC